MDSGFSVRPIGVVAAAPRSEISTLRQTAPTELAPDQSVTAAAGVENVRLDISAASAAMHSIEEGVRRATILDARTGELVFRATDQRSGRVIQQIPDEALLHLRAYVRAESAKKGKTAQTYKVERIA